MQLELRQGAKSDQLMRQRLRCGNLDKYERNFGIASMDRREAFNMVIEHEKKRRQRYDLILRLRPDEFFCTPLPRHGQVDWLGAYSNKLAAFQAYTAPGIQDHAAAMNRAVADVYTLIAISRIRRCVRCGETRRNRWPPTGPVQRPLQLSCSE